MPATGLVADMRYALRVLRLEWRFTVTLAATLAVGVAASGAVFNVVNATLLRPLPIPDEHAVYRLQDYTLGPDGQPVRRSNRVPNYLAIRDQARSFSSVVGMRSLEWALLDGDTPTPINVGLISPGSFELLGVTPLVGRLPSAAEERSGSDSGVAVLSHALWQRQFGGAPAAIGRTVRLEGRLVSIIGVLPPGFRFPYDVEAWVPEIADPAGEFSLAVFARLAPAVSRAQAQSELDAIAAREQAVRPDANRGVGFAMTPIRESLVGDRAQTTVALLVAAGLLLLLAAANVANLLLARGIRRAREVAVRAALGASRGRQIRQALVESLTFAAVGTIAGLAVAYPLSDLLVGLVPSQLTDQLGLTTNQVDLRASLFAALLTTIVGVLAGMAPAMTVARIDAAETLRHGSRGASRGHRWMRSLVVGEVALAAVLLTTAGLMIDNLQRLLSADLGLRADALYAVRLPLPARYDTAERRTQLVHQLRDTAAALPGIERAAVASWNPLERGSFGAALEAEAQPLAPGQSGLIVNHRLVTSEWMQTAGVSLVEGRHFNDRDTAAAERVAIVSQRLAGRLWPGRSAIGQRVRQTRGNDPWITVVGVAGDVRDSGTWEETWYVPYEQHAATLAGSTLHLMVRSPLDAAAIVAAVRHATTAIDPMLPVPEPSVMSTLWTEAQAPQRTGTLLAALFGITGLLLAGLGTYGVLAYLVSLRTREFGIRQALGARPRDVHALVLRDGGLLTAVGLLAGAALSAAASQTMRALTPEVPGVSPLLPWVVATILMTAALLASLVPARRATRARPVDVMRAE